jgi:putative FmdB family regulatory protein
MPLYEYQCDQCEHRFEVIQKFSDPPIEVCPRCSGQVRKLLSSPAIQFKGSGWYITDYARAGKSDSGASGEASASAKADAKPDAKTETKAETKTETKSDAKAESKGTP